jgi:sugar lactone lactonase YvrE
MVTDKQGNLYVADESRIRKITPAGTVTTFAGSSTTGSADGTGTAAQFHTVGSMAMNAAGVLYVVDHDYPNVRTKIRKISPSSVVSTFIDSTILFGLDQIIVDSDDNLLAVFNGIFFSEATIQKITSSKNITQVAKIISPGGIARSALGKLYFTAWTTDLNKDYWKVYQVGSDGKYFAIAGGEAGFADGDGNAVKFLSPNGIVIDADGKIYVADTGNNRIRKITVY